MGGLTNSLWLLTTHVRHGMILQVTVDLRGLESKQSEVNAKREELARGEAAVRRGFGREVVGVLATAIGGGLE